MILFLFLGLRMILEIMKVSEGIKGKKLAFRLLPKPGIQITQILELNSIFCVGPTHFWFLPILVNTGIIRNQNQIPYSYSNYGLVNIPLSVLWRVVGKLKLEKETHSHVQIDIFDIFNIIAISCRYFAKLLLKSERNYRHQYFVDIHKICVWIRSKISVTQKNDNILDISSIFLIF